MSKGAPDYTECTEIKGFDGSNLKTVKVDTDGQLYALMRGVYGSTFKTLAVDANGQLYAILRGASGNDVAVDANGFLTTILKGFDGANYQTIKTDTEGRIEALMKGIYNSTPTALKLDSAGRIIAMLNALYNSTETSLKCDANGNLRLNLTSQDLDQAIFRPKYGGATRVSASTTVNANAYTTLVTITAKGIIYGGMINMDVTTDQMTDELWLYTDGNYFAGATWQFLACNNLIRPGHFPWCITYYDPAAYAYCASFGEKFTFETEFKLVYREVNGNTPTVRYAISYATL